MASLPVLQSTVPTKTRILYIVLFLVSLGSAFFFFTTRHALAASATPLMVDRIVAILFLVLGLFLLYRATLRVDWYEDKWVKKSILGKKEVTYKTLRGYYIDGSITDNIASKKGYFRGVIFKQKNGQRFVFQKEELTQFEKIETLLKTRCKQLNNKSARKMIQKEDRKVFGFIIFLLALIIVSLM